MPRRAVAALLLFAFATPGMAQDVPAPGTRFQVDAATLPPPGVTPAVSNPPRVVRRPPGVGLAVPDGFRATLFAEGLAHPRNLMALPNGDLLLAEQTAGRVTLLRDADGDGRAELVTPFAEGFAQPYGLMFDGAAVFVADTQRVWKLAWKPGATHEGGRQTVTAGGALGDAGGHSTRSLALHPDGSRFYVGIGSRSNLAEEAEPRATIQEFAIDGEGLARGQRRFATGLRNPVGMAFRPGSAELWAVVNERDGLGDGLVPDYLSRVVDGAFYGWPYSYLGDHPQPDFADRAPPKQTATRVPDLLFRAHSAPLGLAFWHGDAFVALHGSWNSAVPQGYFVARVPFTDGRPAGYYEVFATGFALTLEGRARVWGRPVGLAVGADDALYIADDTGNTVWKIARNR